MDEEDEEVDKLKANKTLTIILLHFVIITILLILEIITFKIASVITLSLLAFWLIRDLKNFFCKQIK